MLLWLVGVGRMLHARGSIFVIILFMFLLLSFFVIATPLRYGAFHSYK